MIEKLKLDLNWHIDEIRNKINEIIDFLNNKESYENVLINNFVNDKREEKQCFNCEGKGIIVETMRKDCDIKECPECNGIGLKQSWQKKLEEFEKYFNKDIEYFIMENLKNKQNEGVYRACDVEKLYGIAYEIIEELIKDNEELRRLSEIDLNYIANIEKKIEQLQQKQPKNIIDYFKLLKKVLDKNVEYDFNRWDLRDQIDKLLKYFKEMK